MTEIDRLARMVSALRQGNYTGALMNAYGVQIGFAEAARTFVDDLDALLATVTPKGEGRGNPFGAVAFRHIPAKDAHSPSYVLVMQAPMGSGPLIEINHHADYAVDDDRARWMAAALNSALSATYQDEETFHDIGVRDAADTGSWEAGREAAAKPLTADDVEWVTNDIAELGVKIGDQFFFLYKGYSLVYGALDPDPTKPPVHDDGSPMRWRPVFKREFGECVHPLNNQDPTRWGTVSIEDSDEWKPLPAAIRALQPPEGETKL